MKAEEKRMAQLEEWKGKVAACRGSGQTVDAWCREHGIPSKSYYYWEKVVLSASIEENTEEDGKFVEVTALLEKGKKIEKEPELAAKLRTKTCELEVYAGADAATLSILVQVLKDAQ